MSNEPGERRRRRELERARELATQQAASTKQPEVVASAPIEAAPEPPRSRRERRELERVAELATTQAPSPVVAVEKPAVEKPAVEKPAVEKPAVEKPAVEKPAEATRIEPRTPAPKVPAALSRRAIRNAAGPVDSARTPVVHPPTTTGTIRSVAPAPEPVALRPAGSPPTAGRGYPPVAPRRPSAFPAGLSASAPPVASPTSPPAPAPAPAPASPSALGLSALDAPLSPAARSVAASAPTSAAPGSQAAWSPLTDIPVPTSRRDDAAPGSAGAPLAPRWGNVPPGSFDAITQPDPTDDAATPAGAIAPVAEAKAAAHSHRTAYTWLQMIALALVAFVLGFLVWLLIKDPTEPGAASAVAPTTSTSSSAISSPHLGEQ